MIEHDPDKINDPDRQLESRVVQQAEKYQASRLRSQKENKLKAEGRKEIDKLGFRTDAYQSALRVARDLTPEEQKQYVRDFRYFLKVLGSRQTELWPEDAARAQARAKRKKERAAKAAAAAGKETPEQQQRRLAADTNPRSDPKRGGAGRTKKPKATESAADRAEATAERNRRLQEVQSASPGATIADAATASDDALKAAIDAQEQKEGAEILSQSEIARQKRIDAKLE